MPAMTPCQHPADRRRTLFRAHDYVTRDAFDVVECQECGIATTSPMPTPDRIADYYPVGYHATPGRRRFPSAVVAIQRLLYASRARTTERLAGGRPGRVLDIGCGPGWLLQAFRRRGWQAHGVELTDASAAHAREVLGINVHVGPIEAWPWPEGYFDAVMLWHVLEHWTDPRVVLAKATSLLRPGGVALVAVPNFGSLEARATRDGWFHLDVPRHVVHATPRWLRGELRSHGLESVAMSYFAPEYDAFSFVQSAQNRLGLRHNLLYEVVRGRGGQMAGGRARWPEVALALLSAAPLGLLALPATTALALLGQGSSLTAFAVRRGQAA